MEKLNLEQKRAWVQGLLIECPLNKPLKDCPAKEARALPLVDRFNLMRTMNEDELDQIIAHHQNCLLEREKQLLRRDG